MNRLRWLVLAVVLATGIAACGDDSSTPEMGSGGGDGDAAQPGESGESGESGDATDSFDPPEIDPASMPEPGDVRVEVDGSTFEFFESDAVDSAYACTVDPDTIVTELQTGNGGTIATQVSTERTGEWQGTLTLAPSDTDRIYSSSVGIDGTYAVDGTMAVYEGDFYWRTSADPGLNEDAGTGTVFISC